MNRSSLLSLLFVLFSFALVTPVSAATIAVNTTDDELDASYATDCDPGNEDDCSLREAIELSNENGEDDVISIPSGTYTITIADSGGDEDSNQTGDYDFGEDSQSTTFEGAGAESTIIDANGTGRVFESVQNHTDITLQGLTITGGAVTAAAGGGAAISARSGYTLTLSSIIVDSNTADTVVAAGIYVSAGGDAVVEDSIFRENIQTNNTGGGGGITLDNSGDSIVRNSYFYANEAVDSAGLDYDGNDLLVIGSVFENNVAELEGGAIHAFRPDGTIDIVNSLFVGNSGSSGSVINVRANSGGVSPLNAVVNIIHSTFIDNTGGGALYARGTSADSELVSYTITNSVFYNNTNSSGVTVDTCDIRDGGSVTSGDYNIEDIDDCGLDGENDQVSTDALVTEGDPEDNGGDYNTIGLQAESPAVDLIPAAACLDQDAASLTVDLRGYTRPENTNCDAGAYELDQTDPTISITKNNEDTNTLECGIEEWVEQGASASDAFDSTVATASVSSGSVLSTTVGEYILTYQSEADYDDNQGTAQRTVTVEDTTSPVITVVGSSETVEAGGTYEDDGATVADSCDSSVSVTTTNPVDEDVLGEYTVTYNATDASDNSATQKSRTVTVSDTTAPTITLSGESTVTITVGDTYSDAGASASDSFEGDLSEDVAVSGSVDTTTAGTYTLTYTVSDSSGNAATAVTRTVTVEVADEEPSNDPDDGEGDGSGDTEESLGAVESLTRSTDSTVLVEYENGTTKTFQLFNSSAKAKVQLHTNGEVLIAINKRYMRTFNAFTGEKLDQVKLFKNKQYKTKFKRFNVYKKVPGKNNVMVLAQTKKKHKKQFKLRSFVVKNGGAITKRPYRTVRLNNNTAFSKLSLAKNKKNGKKARILIEKNGKTLKNWKYRVTKKKGILKKAS